MRTEGVWVGCRGGSTFERAQRTADQAGKDEQGEGVGVEAEIEEDDEEIWWAWDGKIVGFADW